MSKQGLVKLRVFTQTNEEKAVHSYLNIIFNQEFHLTKRVKLYLKIFIKCCTYFVDLSKIFIIRFFGKNSKY